VLLNPKLRRRELTEVIQAPGDVKSAIALLALKMVVVSLVGALVPRRLSRYFDRFDPTFIQKSCYRAIDGRHAQTIDPPRSGMKQLLDAQGALGACQDGAHCVALLRFPARAHYHLLTSDSTNLTAAFSGRLRPAPAGAPLTI
jgi:hypothetical protein